MRWLGRTNGLHGGADDGTPFGEAFNFAHGKAFVDRALTMFDRADADRNGTVTQAERKAVRDTMREQWRAKAAQRQQG